MLDLQDPMQRDAQLQRAVALHGRGLTEQAAELYTQILRSHPDHSDALHLLGVAETQRGRPRQGLEWIAKSLALSPNQPVAIANQGNAWLALDDAAAALSSYDRALELWPDYPLGLYGRGNALSALCQPAEAVKNFERALTLSPSFVEAWLALGGVLRKLNRNPDALAAYDRALALSPARVQGHIGRSAVQLALKACSDALGSAETALALEPDCVEAHVARGHALSELGKADAAVDAYARALQLQPTHAVAAFSRGIALSRQGHFIQAAESLRLVLETAPAHPYARGACLHAELQACDWHEYSKRTRDVASAVERDEAADFPFSFLAVCDSPRLQLHCARRFADLHRLPGAAIRVPRRAHRERVRIAYVSADFLEHPTSYLAAGLFEKHDKSRFETIAIALREDPCSATARRVAAAFDRVITPGARSDRELAQLMRELEIDIAVDLMGYTGEHRAGMFALRAAPIQVNYLGYPGTLGVAEMDYLIADEFLIPSAQRANYRENLAYLPDCFQVNDDQRADLEPPGRAAAGLPESALVWCSFHSSYKLNPPLFDVWARLLLAVPDSVLWLLGSSPAAEQNLLREALARGVARERLVFARPLPYADHLARLKLADLCLDTLPFNGGATTSDALWAGVPVVTCVGQSFAARMSGSLLNAIGLAELVTESLEEYEGLALRLARNTPWRQQLRDALRRNRITWPLFDTDRFRRHLEAAYTIMIERHRQGLEPATFKVPPMAP